MYPILLSVAGFHLSSFSVFFILAWCVFSFVFWKSLREEGVVEERIFDLTFYGTLAALAASRAGFVAFHWDQFAGAILRVVALWVAPGLSLYAGILAGMVTMIALAKRAKVRVGAVLDALGLALPGALIVGSVGSLLDGSEIGRPAHVAWGIRYVGIPEVRHPYQLYMIVALIFLLLGVGFLAEQARVKKWAMGTVGVWFILFWASASFALEFFKEHTLYWYTLSVNQWVTLMLFFVGVGVWYTFTGGKFFVQSMIGRIYAKLSKRNS